MESREGRVNGQVCAMQRKVAKVVKRTLRFECGGWSCRTLAGSQVEEEGRVEQTQSILGLVFP